LLAARPMSEGAQRHGFGLYPGVPSIELATLMYDEPGDTSFVWKAGASGAGFGLEGSVGSSERTEFAVLAGPGLFGTPDTSTEPMKSTGDVLSAMFTTGLAAGGDWPKCDSAGSASNRSNTEMAIVIFFIRNLRGRERWLSG
jgi:hypothetical protein